MICAVGDGPLVHAEPRGATLAIVGATVINPERTLGEALAPDTTIIVADGRIRAVGPAARTTVPDGATRIDGAGKWVVPGLVDAHVHFFQSGNLYTRPDVADLTAWMPFARETARNKARLPATLRVWLASGVTSVVDVGGPLWNFEVREIARQTQEAPRIAVAGPLVSMVARPQLDLGDPPIIRVTTPEEARALVRRELAYQPDYVKVWFIHRGGDDLARQEAIVRAAGDTAHAAGVRLAVHATELRVAKAALRAGADYLVHSVEDEPVDDEFLELAARRKALYCPTLFVGRGYELALSNHWQPTDAEQRLADPQVLAGMRDLDVIPRDKLPLWVAGMLGQPLALRTHPLAGQNLRTVWGRGITVVMGTDAGNIGTLPGPAVFREMALMVEAGLTPLEVLRAATTHGATAMRMEGQIGVITPGALADLVVVDDDPLTDLAHLSRIHRVIKGGQPFDPADLLRFDPPSR